MKTKFLLILVLGLSLAGFATAHAQPYAINWYTIDGGGGTSTGGVYSVSGTIGQPDAGGPMNGGNYSITGGLWALTAVQTTSAPLLSIFLTDTNTAVVWWASPSPGWNLRQHTNLTTTNWIAPLEIINDDGTRKSIIVNPPTGNRFYRLFKP